MRVLAQSPSPNSLRKLLTVLISPRLRPAPGMVNKNWLTSGNFTRWHATWNRPREFPKNIHRAHQDAYKRSKEEGESPLSDETLDVVKILSIHKSKGLEFPVIIMGNLHGEVKKDNEILGTAVFDWTTSTTGIVIGKGDQQVRNLQSIVIEKKLNDRSWEEGETRPVRSHDQGKGTINSYRCIEG